MVHKGYLSICGGNQTFVNAFEMVRRDCVSHVRFILMDVMKGAFYLSNCVIIIVMEERMFYFYGSNRKKT